MYKLSPYFKLLILIIATSTMLWIRNWQLTTLFFAIVIGAIFLLKLEKVLLQRIYPLIFISVSIILFQLLFNWQADFATRLILGLVNAEKIIILSLLVFIYSATTSFNELIKLFAFLPKNMQLMLTIAFGMLGTITSEIRQIAIIQTARGLHTKSFNPQKSILPIIMPLLQRSFLRAERIAMMLHTKGW